MQKRLHSSGYLGSLFSRLLFLIAMVIVGQSAWAEEATIYWESTLTSANEITLSNGFKLAISGNTGKSWSKGGGNITLNSTAYTTLKNSNGAQNTLTAPTGYNIAAVRFYAVTNDATTTGKLSEFEGATCTDEVSSLQDYTKPTEILKILATPANKVTFTFGTKQVCFIAVAYYTNDSSKPCIITNLDATATATAGTAKDLSIVAAGATSYQWYKAVSAETTVGATEISGETAATYSYTASAAGTEYLFCAATNTIGTTNSTICAVTASAGRSFTDFKVDFRTSSYTVVAPTTGLPTSVEITGSSNGNQHGYQDGTVKVTVDGPVKFTLGGCEYGSDVTVTNQAGETIATLATKAAGCENGISSIETATYNKNVVWTYNKESSDVLTFTYKYLPYFIAEKCDYVPQVTVTYYDTDGTTVVGEPQTIDGGSALTYKYGASDCTVAEGKTFRGWFASADATAEKIAAGTTVSADLSLYAHATETEVVAAGKTFEYDLTKNYFYPEDHELFSTTGTFHDATHGYSFGANGTVSVQVAGNAKLTFGLCAYPTGGTGTITVTDASGNTVGSAFNAVVATDGTTVSVDYTGDATTLTATFSAAGYLHNLKVENAAPKYTVTCNTAEHGTVTTNAAAGGVEEGTEVTITATPNGGYQLSALSVKDASEQAVTVTNNKFTMPASNVTVSATFVESSVSSYDAGAPFGFATCNSRTQTGYNLIGGGAINPTGATALSRDKVITLTPSDEAMDATIKDAINSHDVIILDGSNGKSFILDKFVTLDGVQNKTLLGINGAKLETKWHSTADDITALEAVTDGEKTGVKNMSTSSGSNTHKLPGESSVSISEQAEYWTRYTMIQRYDPDAVTNNTKSAESWRNSGIFYLKNCQNLIIRNLTFQGPGSMDLGGADIISVKDNNKNLWIDHCDFMDGQDGNMDITNQSDLITVSWCKFHYTSRSYMHQNTNLCGSSDSETADDDKLSITWAYNHWGEGCLQRMPMARFGRFHLLNNYYTSTGCKLCVNALKNSEFLIEGNKFADDLTKVYKAENATQVIWRSNNATGSNLDSGYPLPTADDNTAASTLIPYTYSTSLAAADVATEVGGHVGPMNTYPTSSFTVTASATNGTVAIKNGETAVESGATVEYGTALTFTATPAEGYTFSKWNDGNTDNPRTVTVSGDLSLTAVFIDGSTPFVDKAATISWAIGNESNSTLSDGISNGISTTGVKVGSDLTTTIVNNYAANNGVSMVQYAPATSNAGCVAADMIEYTVQVKKGLTFKPTSVTYDAIKVGTDGAYFSWSYTVDGVESAKTDVSKDNILRNSNTTGSPALSHTETITSDGGQKFTFRFYISNVASGKQIALSNVKINGTINGTVAQRALKAFAIDLTQNPVATLPTGVTQVSYPDHACEYKDAQHGWKWYAIQFATDGPAKITLGGCNYQSGYTGYVTDGTTTLGTINNNACDATASWTYNVEEAKTLTVYCGQYCPSIKVEPCDLIPMRTVTYYNTDGTTKIGEEEVQGGSALAYKYGENDVTVASGYKFRGWFNSTAATAIKVAEGTSVDDNLSLYAKATKIENPQVGDIYNYPFGNSSFYYQDHEGITEFTGKYNDATHGYYFIADQKISVKVAGNAVITFGICKYAATDAKFTVTDANGSQVGEQISAYNETDGSVASVKYEGDATTLTFTASGKSYMHNMTIYNVASIPTKNEQGYYVIKSGDAASLKLAAASLQDGDKIYLPNGTYDLGSDLTSGAPGITISANNVSLIGESMENTIVKGYGIVESINTATVKSTGDNFYAQDITLQCYADYGTGSDTKTAERALGLWNCSKHSTLKNVYLQGTQDTYYTNYGSAGQLGYVEGGRIDGTVDYICGAGNHYFNGVKLYVVNSAHRTSKDVIVAPNMTADDAYGYVFKDAVIDGAASQKGTYFLARPWNNSPACTWIDTKINLATAAAGYTNMTAGKVLRFHEYNTQDADGNVITSHNLDACGGAEGSDALYLTEEQTATYTVANVLGDWATTAQSEAAQVTTMPTEGIFLLADGTMTTTVPTKGIVRVANTRGGFGPEIALTVPEEGSVQIIANVKEDNVATPEGTTPEEKAAAVTAVKGVTEANTAVTDVKTGMANAVNTDAIQFEGVTIPEGTQIILSMDIVYDNASVSKENDEAVVKSMTFEVKPIATAKVENTAYSTTVSNSAIKGYITFRLPVAMNANYKFANVKHEGEDFGQKAVLTHETTGEKYIELVVSSFSKYSYELTNDEIAPDEVALSEEDEAYPENGVWNVDKAYNITLSRTMSKDKWNTLMLPFPMTAEEVKTSFGAEAKVMKMTGIENYVVKFETATAIDACEPYIVQPAADVATISVTHKTGLKSTITDNDHHMELEATATCGGATKFGTWTAASCFANSTISKEKSCYILSGNKFYLVNNDVSVKGYRWAFGETGATSAKGSLDMSFDGVVTGISEINANANITANGKYMKDGRIVIIKDGKQFNAAGQEVK